MHEFVLVFMRFVEYKAEIKEMCHNMRRNEEK